MTLITKEEVLDLAFSGTDHATEEIIKETKIVAAQEKYIRPVFGELYEAMREGRYKEFVKEYIKPPLAYYVRYGVIPDTSVKVSNSGSQVHFTPYSQASSIKEVVMAREQALDDAMHLLKRAVREVEQNPTNYPEYRAKDNIRKRVYRNGGIVL